MQQTTFEEYERRMAPHRCRVAEELACTAVLPESLPECEVFALRFCAEACQLSIALHALLWQAALDARERGLVPLSGRLLARIDREEARHRRIVGDIRLLAARLDLRGTFDDLDDLALDLDDVVPVVPDGLAPLTVVLPFLVELDNLFSMLVVPALEDAASLLGETFVSGLSVRRYAQRQAAYELEDARAMLRDYLAVAGDELAGAYVCGQAALLVVAEMRESLGGMAAVAGSGASSRRPDTTA